MTSLGVSHKREPRAIGLRTTSFAVELCLVKAFGTVCSETYTGLATP